MGNAAELPADVATRVRKYLDALETENADFVRHVYLVGSIALGDYRKGVSDIDFVALVAHPLGNTQCAALARVHAAMAGDKPHFDGFYIEQAELRTVPQPKSAPCIIDGVFQEDAVCFEINPVTWMCLAQKGIRIKGHPRRDLDIAIGAAALLPFEIGNLRSYWIPWIDEGRAALARKDPASGVTAAVMAWGVLGVLRIGCTLATGQVVSKTQAGEWALSTYPLMWHPAILDALAARSGELLQLPVIRCQHALAFMQHVIDQVFAKAPREGPCAR